MKVITLYFLFLSSAFAQFDSRSIELPGDTLARVGSTIITAKDFLERFELMPWPNKDKKERIEFSKLEFLYSLVAEKLLAMEATSQNIGFDAGSLKLQNNLERMFVRDELYKREVLSNITVSPDELREGMARLPYTVEVAVLGILSKQEGELLYKKVVKSKKKKATLSSFVDSLYVPIDTIRISFGYPDKGIEDAVYSIGRDSLSKPLETKVYGWVMFSLLNKSTNEQYSKFSHPDRLHKVDNIIKQWKEDSIAVRTFAAMTSPQRAEVDPEIFYIVADSVFSILWSDSSKYESKGVYQFPLTAMNLLEEKLAALQHKTFISIESGTMTLGDVLTGLSNNNVVFPKPLNREVLRIVLNNNIKTVVQNELIAREGLKKNLQQTENVRHDLSVWMDNRKSRLLLMNIVDTMQHSTDSLQPSQRNEFVQNAVDVYIGSLAKKYDIVVEEAVLRTVHTTTTSMVTWRHMGFGGRIIAVPQVLRQFEWKYEWQKQKLLNQ